VKEEGLKAKRDESETQKPNVDEKSNASSLSLFRHDYQDDRRNTGAREPEKKQTH